MCKRKIYVRKADKVAGWKRIMNVFKNFEFSTATNGGFVLRGAQCIKVRTGPLRYLSDVFLLMFNNRMMEVIAQRSLEFRI